MPSVPASPRFGLAGWSFPEWESLFAAAPRSRRAPILETLAVYFDTAEINTSFYHAVKPEVARLWLRQVSANERFRFTAKLNRQFTHERTMDQAGVAQFLRGVEPLAEAGRFGCLLMQFPWSFRFTAENRAYLIRLRRAFSRHALVAEMRHESWASDEAVGMMIDYHIGFANIDQAPHVRAMKPTSLLTSPVGYIRLLGRDSGHWLSEYSKAPALGTRYDYLYTPEQLEPWKERVRRVSAFATDTYVVFANDARAQSAVNALQLRAMVTGRPQAVPQALRRRYWHELHAYSERPRQATLFEPRLAMAC